jgi:hypothetical protein
MRRPEDHVVIAGSPKRLGYQGQNLWRLAFRRSVRDSGQGLIRNDRLARHAEPTPR